MAISPFYPSVPLHALPYTFCLLPQTWGGEGGYGTHTYITCNFSQHIRRESRLSAETNMQRDRVKDLIEQQKMRDNNT